MDAAQVVWSLWDRTRHERRQQQQLQVPVQQYVTMAPRLLTFECYAPEQMSQERIDDFLDRMTDLVEYPRERTTQAMGQMHGEASMSFKRFIKSSNGLELPTWDGFKALVQRFFGRRPTVTAVCHQKSGKNPQQFYARVYQFFVQHFPETDRVEFRNSNPMKKVIKENFVLGLDHNIRSQLGNTQDMTNEAVILKASDIWAANGPEPTRAQHQIFDVEAIRRPYESPKEKSSGSDTQEAILNTLKEIVAGFQNAGKQQAPPARQSSTLFRQKKAMICFYCDRPGHMVRDCKKKQNDVHSGRNKDASDRVKQLEKQLEEMQASSVLDKPVKE